MNASQLRQRWTEQSERLLVGRTITQASYIPDDEFGSLLVILLDDGTQIFPMRDDEGNGPGALHWANGEKYGILPTV